MNMYDQIVAGCRSDPTLQRDAEFRATLLAMAGHDLRQPLQVISGILSWLARRRGIQPCEMQQIQSGELAIARLTDQLDHLVEAVRMLEHGGAVQLSPVAVGPLICSLCRECAHTANRRGLRLDFCPTSAVVMSDVGLLEGILRNLLYNGLKYTPTGGRVLLGCRRHGSSLRIEIHDTGIGIPEDQFRNIFEAFHRLDSSADGLGLGLFIARHAAHLLNHQIEVQSVPGRGTCFSVHALAQL